MAVVTIGVLLEQEPPLVEFDVEVLSAVAPGVLAEWARQLADRLEADYLHHLAPGAGR